MPVDTTTPDTLKHSLYGPHLTRQELNSLRKMSHDDLNPEIGVIRLMISRMLALYSTQTEVEPAILVINAITRATRSLNTLVRTQVQLDGENGRNALDNALVEVLKDEPFFVGKDAPPPEPTPEPTGAEAEAWYDVFRLPENNSRTTNFPPICRRPRRTLPRLPLRLPVRPRARQTPAPLSPPAPAHPTPRLPAPSRPGLQPRAFTHTHTRQRPNPPRRPRQPPAAPLNPPRRSFSSPSTTAPRRPTAPHPSTSPQTGVHPPSHPDLDLHPSHTRSRPRCPPPRPSR